MVEPLGVTRLLNDVAGPAVTAVLHTIGIHPANPAAPIDNRFSLEFLVFLGLIAFFVLVRATLSVEKPNPAQQIADAILADVTRFQGVQDRFDDETIIVLRVR